jgi:hypothetical protein
MRSTAWALLLCSTLLLTSGREPERHVIPVSNAGELMELFATPLKDVIVQLAPGTYALESQMMQFPIGAGSEGTTPVTVGLKVTGRNVRLVGSPETAELVSTAIFGLYFDGCDGCELERIALLAETASPPDSTGGASILVMNSAVKITNCVILDRTSPPTTDGIIAAAGATLEIVSSEIASNGNGMTLIEDAEAILRNNLIEGIRTARYGLFVVDRASVLAEKNQIRNFSDGIHLAGGPSLVLRANIIEDIEERGIWSSAVELGRVRIEKNVIFRCGGAGIAMRAEGDQRASQNLIVETGRRKPQQSGIQIHGAQADAAARKNTLYDNAVAESSTGRDVPREKFWRERRGWTRTYRNTPVGVDGRHKFHESAFLTRYGRWLH